MAAVKRERESVCVWGRGQQGALFPPSLNPVLNSPTSLDERHQHVVRARQTPRRLVAAH